MTAKPDTAFVFRTAERAKVKLKAMINGPSGSGKSKGALYLARGLDVGEIAAIDSENDRMLYYADEFPFKHLSLSDIGSVTPAAYKAALDAAVAAGFKVVVIDSLHHAWQDLLDRKEKYDKANPGSNGFANWKMFGREWDDLIRHILEAPVHVIATSRSKQEYQLVDHNGGKKPIKLGVNPTVREGTEYEFALVFDVMPSHSAHCTKDNTGLFGTDADTLWDLKDPDVAGDIRRWLSSAKAEEKVVARKYEGPRFVKMKGLEEHAGKPLPELPLDVLKDGYARAQGAAAKQPDNERIAQVFADLSAELEDRNNAAADAALAESLGGDVVTLDGDPVAGLEPTGLFRAAAGLRAESMAGATPAPDAKAPQLRAPLPPLGSASAAQIADHLSRGEPTPAALSQECTCKDGVEDPFCVVHLATTTETPVPLPSEPPLGDLLRDRTPEQLDAQDEDEAAFERARIDTATNLRAAETLAPEKIREMFPGARADAIIAMKRKMQSEVGVCA
jgi:hypothetical protein